MYVLYWVIAKHVVNLSFLKNKDFVDIQNWETQISFFKGPVMSLNSSKILLFSPCTILWRRVWWVTRLRFRDYSSGLEFQWVMPEWEGGRVAGWVFRFLVFPKKTFRYGTGSSNHYFLQKTLFAKLFINLPLVQTFV